ncbi:MAG TPA: pirin family protein [bacterium]|nr:pirin family protein [bacterium]HPR87326.1 pirin family protein [bacterium]
MTTFRTIEMIARSMPTLEGAGVRLQRAFGFSEAPNLDPFLLLDHFGSKNPDDYLAGFPWHPHRGIETVTYLLTGAVEHGDSLGNTGVIRSGEVQWMTAGSGIIHQEMPQHVDEPLLGFQLWVNLPAAQKMMPPRYNSLLGDQIPAVELEPGINARVISGTLAGVQGPMRDLIVDVGYYDLTLAPGARIGLPIPAGHRAFAYLFAGSGAFDATAEQRVESSHLVVFSDAGQAIQIRAGEEGMRFLLAHGHPLNEPVAWRGPIVMNTDEELRTAFAEFRAGTFIKHQPD